MRVPIVNSNQPTPRLDLHVTGILVASVLMGVLVWTLAIAKLIDLCTSH